MAEPVTINGVTYEEQPQEQKSFTKRVGSGFRKLMPRSRLEPEPDESLQAITPTPAEPQSGRPAPVQPRYGQPTPVSSRYGQPTPAEPRHGQPTPAEPRHGQPTPVVPTTANTASTRPPVRYDLSPALKSNTPPVRPRTPTRVITTEMETVSGPTSMPVLTPEEPRRIDTHQPLMRVPEMRPSGEQPKRIPAQPVATEPRPLLLFDPNPLTLDEEPATPPESMDKQAGDEQQGDKKTEDGDKTEQEKSDEDTEPKAAEQPSASSSPQGIRPLYKIDPYWDYRGDAEESDEERRTPEDTPLTAENFAPRMFAHEIYTWEASNVSYKPLYFEDVPLERYGHTYSRWIQPFVSVGKFGTQLIGLPYQMALHPPCEEVYPLGYYQPGECAPKKTYQIPWNAKAAAVQGATMTGLFYAIP